MSAEFKPGDKVIVEGLWHEWLTEPTTSECPVCEHQSLLTGTGILWLDDTILAGPGKSVMCMEQCQLPPELSEEDA